MLKTDPNYAQPLYSIKDNRIHYIIPLIIGRACAGGLVVKNNRVCTLYSGEMVVQYASVFNRATLIWLESFKRNLSYIKN